MPWGESRKSRLAWVMKALCPGLELELHPEWEEHWGVSERSAPVSECGVSWSVRGREAPTATQAGGGGLDEDRALGGEGQDQDQLPSSWSGGIHHRIP